jgi:photosystem II stability/assembly factor-like uncharacterized protein
MVASDDGWAVGDGGTMISYNGSEWLTAGSPTSEVLYGVDMVASDDGWAVGASGKILQYNGSEWSEFSDKGNIDFNSVDMISSADGWIAGDDGVIYRYNGSGWDEHSDVGQRDLYDISMVSADDGWSAGDQGEIYKYDGTDWGLDQETGNMSWRAIDYGTENGYVVGTAGNIYHYNGTDWGVDSSPTNRQLNDLQLISDLSGWAVGDSGTILRLTGTVAFEEAGNLTSSAFDMSDVSPVQVIEWDEVIPLCSPICQVRFQLRTAPDSSGSPGTWTSWHGASGAGSYFSVSDGEMVPSDLNGNQWVQYKVYLSGDGDSTPVLEEIRVSYK